MNRPADSNEELIEGFHPDEFGYATWEELTPAFAAGSLVFVAAHLDFHEVAEAVETDDTDSVSGWMRNGDMLRVNDELAKKWTDEGPVMFRFLIRQPLVLIQPIPFDASKQNGEQTSGR
jgi:hypothetical protein